MRPVRPTPAILRRPSLGGHSAESCTLIAAAAGRARGRAPLAVRVARDATGCGRAGDGGTAAADEAGPGARSTNDRRSVRGTSDPAPPDQLRRSEQPLELALQPAVADLADLERQAA